MSQQRSRTIDIPLRDSPDEVIELDLDQLPEGQEVLGILKQEQAYLHIWITLALEYYKKGQQDEFVSLLEASGSDASLDYADFEKDQMRALDTLAAHYVALAHKETNKEKRREYFTKSTLLYTTADKIIMYDQQHLLGRAHFCLLEGDKLDQAEAQFNFVLNLTQNCIPALLGRACISFQRKDYRQALNMYKKVLRLQPNCPADVRLGMGLCFNKLGKSEKAQLAFERCLQLDPLCIGALVGLAVIQMNSKTPEGIRAGVELLGRAYTLQQHNPVVLNHLANHFFFKKEYNKVEHLAWHAFQNTENEAMRAESCYQLARAYHVQAENADDEKDKLDQAFKYYYQSAQFATPNFVLPHFGLGQMYIYRGDLQQAAVCFEKVLKVQPTNYETMKILGSIYSQSEKVEQAEKALELLQKVVENTPEDVEAWIELAQVCERHDPQRALDSYQKAEYLLSDTIKVDVPSELLNNMGSLHFRLSNVEKAEEKLQLALVATENLEDFDQKLAGVTIQYNIARVFESKNQLNKAEELYKSLLLNYPTYIDCYLRLGCIARDRGQIFDASVWFKEALQVQQDHPDAWALIGNLHLAKHEYGPAQKKFERILKQPEYQFDPYALVALGNVWLETGAGHSHDKDKQRKHLERAMQMYKTALKSSPKCIWAAHGIGCVLALNNYLPEARDVFAQVREATAELPDVWLNIAHLYTHHRQYQAAIQVYENCLRKFYPYHFAEILQYLARALFLSGKLRDSMMCLVRARTSIPQDNQILYNLALVLQKLAAATLKDQKATLKPVEDAMTQLRTAKEYFKYLHEKLRQDKHFTELGRRADKEHKRCNDFMSHAEHVLTRAIRTDAHEREIRQRQEEERQLLRQKQQEEETRRQEELERRQLELSAKRQEFIEKTKNIRQMPDIPDENERPKKARPRKHRGDEFVNDSSDLGEYEGAERKSLGERSVVKKKKKIKRHHSRSFRDRRRRHKHRHGLTVKDSDEDEEPSARVSGKHRDLTTEHLSAKQKSKVKSRAYLSSTSSSSEDEKAASKPKSKETISDNDDDENDLPQTSRKIDNNRSEEGRWVSQKQSRNEAHGEEINYSENESESDADYGDGGGASASSSESENEALSKIVKRKAEVNYDDSPSESTLPSKKKRVAVINDSSEEEQPQIATDEDAEEEMNENADHSANESD